MSEELIQEITCLIHEKTEDMNILIEGNKRARDKALEKMIHESHRFHAGVIEGLMIAKSMDEVIIAAITRLSR